MLSISDIEFEKIIATAMDQLPEKYVKGLSNVLIVFENEPTPEQREKLRLRCNETLYGLYEGIPTTKRTNNYSMVLPDKITLFKNPIAASSTSLLRLKSQVKHTLWHEIAHHYGLDHDRIHKLEQK